MKNIFKRLLGNKTSVPQRGVRIIKVKEYGKVVAYFTADKEKRGIKYV